MLALELQTLVTLAPWEGSPEPTD